MIPVEVDPDTAREAAARELADPAYRAAEPSLASRVLDWLGRRIADLLSGLGGPVPGGLVVVVVLALAVFAVVRVRVGRLTGHRRGDRPVFDRVHTTADHRRAAELAYERGDLTDAVRERFRAIVRELEAKGVLDQRHGRTVDEIAARAGERLPDHRHDLRRAATLFDDVVYGGRRPTDAAYRDLADLDDRLRHARPALAAR